ncbi:elicitor-responsive protein [Trifolium repens]|nr:elicitor-responsive protein [Trifolium repens]
MPHGMLEVILISAKGLHKSDFLKKIDPYVILTYRSKEHRSSVAKGPNPNWSESFLFTISVHLRLMDEDAYTKDDFIGETIIDLEPVFDEGSIAKTSYNVVKEQNYCGEIKVALTFRPEVNLSMLQHNN